MNINLSQLDISELFGRFFKFGFTAYTVALLVQVIESYNLV